MKKDMKTILDQIDEDLRKNIDLTYERKTHLNAERYSDYYGVRTAVNRDISGKYYAAAENLNKDEILRLCEELLKSGIHEKKTVAFDWAFRLRENYTEEDFSLFESWLFRYVNNYGLCDDLCTHALGETLCRFPDKTGRLFEWIKSGNLWVRRAAPVTLIRVCHHRDIAGTAFDISKMLFNDSEPLVHKGFGWLLKELSENHFNEVRSFLTENRAAIPRTALRYAIEKMPGNIRAEIMAR